VDWALLCFGFLRQIWSADDVALLAKLLELLVPALETMPSDDTSLGLEVNWLKTKVQALGSRDDH